MSSTKSSRTTILLLCVEYFSTLNLDEPCKVPCDESVGTAVKLGFISTTFIHTQLISMKAKTTD